MEQLITFENDQFGNVRTIEENGKIYFCGNDVARALGYSNCRDALGKHCKGVVKRDTPTTSGVQSMSFIPEGDLYRLITHSKLPTAEKFEQWVFDEVLPTIRQTGKYDVSEQDDTIRPMMLPDAKDYLTAARLIAHCPKERLRIVINLLENGGFDTSLAKQELAATSTANISDVINETIERTGLSCRRIAEIIGIPENTLTGYKRKERFPKPEKYNEIVGILKSI